MDMRYSEDIKKEARALSMGMGSRKIAKVLNIPRSTIRYWINDNHKRSVNYHSAKNKPKYREKCRVQSRLYARQYYDNHKEDLEFRLKNSIRNAKWRKKHPHASRDWSRKNRSKASAYRAKYRARKKGNGGSFTAAEWEALKKETNYSCLLCGFQEPEIQLVPDHIVPISYGGTSNIDNIQPLCKSCNSKKSNDPNFWQKCNC